MRDTIVGTVLLLVVSGLVAPVTARGAEGDPPCLADVKRLCALVPPYGNYLQSCLEERRAELSKDCSRVVDNLTRDTSVLAAACRWDLVRFCSDVTNAAGEHLRCLIAHRDKLSPKCLERLDDAEPVPTAAGQKGGAEPAPAPSGDEGAPEGVVP